MISRFVLLLFLPLFSIANSGNAYYFSVNENSWVNISGTTNVNSWQCLSSGNIPGGFVVVELCRSSNTMKFSDAGLKIDITGFKCSNRLMNKDVHRALGADSNPYIEINLLKAQSHKAFSPSSNRGSMKATVEIALNGTLRIVEINIDWYKLDGFRFIIAGTQKLLMSDFKIDPPTPLMGIVKADNSIEIEFHLIVETGMMTKQ